MRKSFRTGLTSVLVAGMIGWPGPAPARVGGILSFADAFDAADVAVIAEHVSTWDSGYRVTRDRAQPPEAIFYSQCRVLAVLKDPNASTHVGSVLRIRHYRTDIEAWRRQNPPEPGQPPAGFLNGPRPLEFSDDAGPYLMVLDRLDDGAYVTTYPDQPEHSIFRLSGLGGSRLTYTPPEPAD